MYFIRFLTIKNITDPICQATAQEIWMLHLSYLSYLYFIRFLTIKSITNPICQETVQEIWMLHLSYLYFTLLVKIKNMTSHNCQEAAQGFWMLLDWSSLINLYICLLLSNFEPLRLLKRSLHIQTLSALRHFVSISSRDTVLQNPPW